MYAIVRVGNKQYRVEKGDTLLVDRVREDEGSKLDLEPLLYRSDETIFDGGDLEKVKVEAAVVGHERGKKIHGLKFKPKRGYKRRFGARADLTRIEIKDIKLLSRKPASSAKPKAEPETEAAGRGEEAAGSEEGAGEEGARQEEGAGREEGAGQEEGTREEEAGSEEEGNRQWLIRKGSAPAATAATRTPSAWA